MLTEYIRRHDIDIVFLQEIRNPKLLTMAGYVIYYNIGSFMRGRAIVARKDIALMNMKKLPSGRAIAAEYRGLYIVNINAPSGTANRAEPNTFTMPKYHKYYKSGMGNS